MATKQIILGSFDCGMCGVNTDTLSWVAVGTGVTITAATGCYDTDSEYLANQDALDAYLTHYRSVYPDARPQLDDARRAISGLLDTLQSA